MRRLLALTCLLAAPLLLAAEARADVTALPKFPGRSGYAFDKPRVLLQQRLFGLYHGVTLLARACAERTRPGNPAKSDSHLRGAESPEPPSAASEVASAEPGDAVQAAYRHWRETQEEAIAAARADVGRYYFGAFAAEASDGQLVQALGLKPALDVAAAELDAACATLPEALAKNRYDLKAQFHLQALLGRLSSAAATEGRVAYCRRRLVRSAVQVLDDALAKWHAEYHAGLAEARAVIAPRWQDAALDRPLEDWLLGIRKALARSTLAGECVGLETWLATPAADPDLPFKVKP